MANSNGKLANGRFEWVTLSDMRSSRISRGSKVLTRQQKQRSQIVIQSCFISLREKCASSHSPRQATESDC